jgi:hypothetical protein
MFVHMAALHPLLDPDDDPDDDPLDDPDDEVPDDEPVSQAPLVHVPGVQSAHAAPPVPHIVSDGDDWQLPVESQQPLGHEVPSQGAETSSPPLLLVPELLAPELLAPELLAPELLVPELLPPELLLFPPSNRSPSPGPPVAHANEKAPTSDKTRINGATGPRKCILSVYLATRPLQGSA